MARPIKFRVWDKEAKEMLEPGSVDLEYSLHNSGGWHELMQYTGLHDKNGKEIYEGDIIVIWRLDGDPIEEEQKLVVQWDDDEAMFHTGDKYNNPLARHVAEDGIEVIGNIYEHPHLLERK